MLVTTLPLYDYLVIRPSLEKFYTESTNDEAEKIAKDFVALFLPKKMGLSKWKQIESFIRDHSEAEFTHSICPKCAKKFYPELFQE